MFQRDSSVWDTSVSDIGWKDDRVSEDGESWVEDGVAAGESVVVWRELSD